MDKLITTRITYCFFTQFELAIKWKLFCYTGMTITTGLSGLAVHHVTLKKATKVHQNTPLYCEL